jgi:tetratricopeptide (TPR) repeat protein
MTMNLLSLALAVAALMQTVSPTDRAGIIIINGAIRGAAAQTRFEAGFEQGGILNAHYFPGLQDYANGMYSIAESQMSYLIERPSYLSGNPRAGQFLSTAHYTRGMIYFYHAEGIGRHRLAIADFEAAIRWNHGNWMAYLELSRVYSELGRKDAAIEVLGALLEQMPDQPAREEAQAELHKLGGK